MSSASLTFLLYHIVFSGENIDMVKHYIANQETHHSHLSFDDEWLALHNKLIDYSNVMEMDSDVVED